MSAGTQGRRWIGRALAGFAIAVIGVFVWARRDLYAPLDAGSEAPDYQAVTLEGDSLSIQGARGQVVLLNVWATWCRPCVREMPAIQRLYEALSPQGLTVLAVSVDNAALALGDPAQAVRGFVDEFKLTFPILLDPDNRIQSVYQVTAMPTTYVIGRDGVIRQRFLGPREWDQPEFEAEIRALLNGAQ